MIHNPAGCVCGEAVDMRKYADLLEKIGDTLISDYVGKTGLSNDDVRQKMNAETWMTADEAVEFGFVDSVGESEAIAAYADTDDYSKYFQNKEKYNEYKAKMTNNDDNTNTKMGTLY